MTARWPSWIFLTMKIDLHRLHIKCAYHAKFQVNWPSHIGEPGADVQIVQYKLPKNDHEAAILDF